MAVEKSPGDKGAFTPPETPAPQAPSIDEEKIRMAEELRQAKAALGEVGEMVKSGKLKLAEEAPQQPQEPEDDSALVDKKELKRFAQGLQQTVAQAFVHTTAHQARQMRDAQIELLRGKLKDFDKHEAEIRGLLDKVDPTVASNPDTIRQVHRIVSANHKDEEIEQAKREAREQALAELRSQGIEIPEDETLEEVEPEETRPTTAGRAQSAKPVARPSGGVAPSGDASASRPLLRSRNERVEPLSREERVVMANMGFPNMTAEEYRRYSNPNWHPDTQGSKGRTKF